MDSSPPMSSVATSHKINAVLTAPPISSSFMILDFCKNVFLIKLPFRYEPLDADRMRMADAAPLGCLLLPRAEAPLLPYLLAIIILMLPIYHHNR